MFHWVPILHPQLWHQFFEGLAMLCGVQLYRYNTMGAAKTGLLTTEHFPLVIGALLGAGIGNKLVFWLERVDQWNVLLTSPQAWFMGQSMVGGLLGGLLGVELAKKISGIKQSTGDRFVYPILLALCIGRIGCFVAGLSDDTYGVATNLPFAVDFGDGVARHPTQLYEIIFALILWIVLTYFKPVVAVVPGLQFKLMLTAYLLWRLVIDFIKPVFYVYPGGLSGIQYVCVVALMLYMPSLARDIGVLLQCRFRKRDLIGEENEKSV